MSIEIFTTIPGIRQAIGRERKRDRSVAVVPTMGALHAGHASLIESARERGGLVVVSIFVNPLQFDQREDYERYTRGLGRDAEVCEQSGADMIFAPTVGEMYPHEQVSFVEVSGITEHFCGRSRPGHFRGVATVVSKLFHIVEPDVAFFGEKDAQQLAVIQRMVEDLDFPVEIAPAPTVRELGGLAMSSRNERLTPHQREVASALFRALTEVRGAIEQRMTDGESVLSRGRGLLQHPEISVEYFDLADPASMQPVQSISGPVRIMGAIRIGGTRLIDNMLATART